MSTRTELEIALEAVVTACRVARRVQADLVDDATATKKDRSPVTVADFGVQAIVSDRLGAAFPSDPLVGEETTSMLEGDDGAEMRERVVRSVQAEEPAMDEEAILAAIARGHHPGGSPRFWTVDPIDGTKGFLRRDQYAIAVALIEDGTPVVGVLGCPNLADGDGGLGCVFASGRDGGTTLYRADGSALGQVHTTAVDDPAEAVMCESVEAAHSAHDDHARVAELLGITRPSFRIDSQCKYGAVARGDASVYLRLPSRPGYREKIWDHAAGAAVVTGAGGRVSDLDGNDLDFSAGRTLAHGAGVLVTNGPLHDRVVAAVREVLGR